MLWLAWTCKKTTILTQPKPAAADNPGMESKQRKKRSRVHSAFIPFRKRRQPAIEVRTIQPFRDIRQETGCRRIVAMTLAQELADTISATPEQREQLICVALDIGQWLADEGYPGQWDMVRPAAVLRCLDFLPQPEKDRYLYSCVGLLGHGALSGQISHGSVRRSLEEIINLTQAEQVRTLARTTAARLRPGLPS